ncbi:family 1 glycosylhydrolase [Alkalibacterium sp. f15]|uniref:family 1 glycosylhydrolase n=1 Tax=Alkalibacterium sp. f15 TaxID=3414029 RepID=UPI003BF77D1D
MIRYGIPWYKIEEKPGEFNWDWVDEVMAYFKNNPSLTPIIDLVHYGTPHWMQNAFANGRYPQYVARFARAFAERYGDFIKYYTPLNEPYVTAEFCGLNAVWPPYLEGLTGYYQIMCQVSKGIVLTQKVIKEVVPDAVFVHVDATKRYFTHEKRLNEEVKLWNENRFVMWELVQGLLDEAHPLYEFLLNQGVTPETLDWFKRHNVEPDIIGLNYYPQFSVHEISRDNKGNVSYPNVSGTGEDFKEIATEAYRRYQRPILLTETSYRGSEEKRIAWLHEIVKTCEDLIEIDIKVIGITWFPFFDLVDWGYRTSGKTVEEELLPFGLYTLTNADGKLLRQKNRVAMAFEKLVDSSKMRGDL